MNARKRARICLFISAGLIGLALLLFLVGAIFRLPLGINLGIDFKGGQSLTYRLGTRQDDGSLTPSAADQVVLEGILTEAGITGGQVKIQGEDKSEAVIRIPTAENLEAVRSDLLSRLHAAEVNGATPYSGAEEIASSAVSGTFSRTLVSNAVTSVLIASLLMLCYIAIRFDLNSGLAAVFGLLHDVLMMLAFMVFLRPIIQMNATFIAALLTIVGYSINNTIIIFDRIRQNARRMPGTPRWQVAERSVKESLGRTINTTLTTLVTIVLLYILGVDSIKEFALPIIVGILSGVYSANLINGYVWAWLEERRTVRKLNRPAVEEEE